MIVPRQYGLAPAGSSQATSPRIGTCMPSCPASSGPPARPRSAKLGTTRVNDLEAESALSTMKLRRNPHASKPKKSVTLRLSEDVVEYFKLRAHEAGVPYQSLINLYLRDCPAQNRKVEIKWPSAA